MVYRVYKRYARPLARVVHGLQTSWDPVVATVYDERFGYGAVWSPCNTFIAVAKLRAVEIRDAMTLNLLFNFESALHTSALSFSPDSRFLTQFDPETMVTWDLQTGVSVITASPEELVTKRQDSSPAYSKDGKMLAAEYINTNYKDTFIITHNFSTTHTHSYRVSEGHPISPPWTHGEFLRFATVKSGCITIWQVEFTFTHPPEAVESLPAPDEISNREASVEYLFLPMTSRLAIALEDTLLVWDAQNSKCLLKISDSPYYMSFSSDGRFFACILRSTGTHIWKESPAGYILHRKLTFGGSNAIPRPLLSPNGESIFLSCVPVINFGDPIIRLLHTEDPFLSSRPTLDMAQHSFILNFPSNEALVAFARYPEKVVTILDLQSGNPRFEIDTGMDVKCLRVAGSTLLAANSEKIVTWKLDTKNARADIHDSIRIDSSPPFRYYLYPQSVSFDLTRIITWETNSAGDLLAIYDVLTGRRLTGPMPAEGALKPLSTRARFKATDTNGHVGVRRAWFTPDGCEIWGTSSLDYSACDGWEVIEDSESGTTKLQPLTATACPAGVFPWQSSHGYEVTHDGWILSPTQKRLLWLPHRWRSFEEDREWGGRFLGLFHSGLPELVILEFLV